MKKSGLVFFVLALLAAAPCFSAANDVSVTAQANNEFAFDIYARLNRAEADKNIFISPYSISTAMAMTYEGVSGTTADEMMKVMHFPDSLTGLRLGYSGMQGILNAKDRKYELSSANSIWPQTGYKFSDNFLEALDKFYGGKAELVDYAGNKAGAISRINGWTAKNTKGKIPEIIGEDDVNELTRLVLVNAVYFKGAWEKSFDQKKTVKADFTGVNDKKVKADMMNTQGRFMYAESGGAQVLELPYAGGDISMIVVLPGDGDIIKLETSMTAGKFNEWLSELSEQKVNVSMPKFRINCKYSLKEPLIDLGMTEAFDEYKADLSKMADNKDLYISDVIHATFLDVNEEGTEAAAATAVIVAAKSIEMTPRFSADHPFIFFIYDRTAGAILFMGKMNDPSYKN